MCGAPLGVFAGACGGGEGEGAVAGVGPVGAGVGPGADDEGGRVVVLGQETRFEVGDVQGCSGAGGVGEQSGVASSGLSESSEGQGVAAGFGGEALSVKVK